MEDFFSGLFAVIVCLYIFLVSPIYDRFTAVDNYINNRTKVITNQFQKEVRKNGFVDKETFNKFLDELNKTKRPYKIEMIHSSKLVYPYGIGDYKIEYIKYGNKQIYDCIESRNKYLLKYGDEFEVTVTEMEVGENRALIAALRGLKEPVHLSFSFGGMVENENN